MPQVSVDADAYQSLSDIRDRINHEAGDFYDDNAQLRFDELLVRLEREARGIFETLWGDETPLEENGRVDERRTTDDAAMAMPYPVRDVTKVEIKRSLGSDWDEIDSDWYDFTKHRLILARSKPESRVRRDNPAARLARRPAWMDLAVKIRVTYDRGFAGGAPADVKSIQIDLINKLLRQLKREQTVSAASPSELSEMTDRREVVTEEIRNRISDVTSPGRATMSV